MYAIFEAKGKQFRAERDEVLRMPTLKAAPGDKVTFDQVLLAEQDGKIIVGQPTVDGASIAAEVVRHGRGEKIIVFKMKRRKGYRKKQGHRQNFTEVRVTDIDFGKGKSVKREAPKSEAASPVKAEAKPKAVKEEKPVQDAQVVEAPVEAESAAIEIDATDTARELAAEAGIDLASIDGTGKEGRILKSDVQKAIKAKDEG